MNSYDSLKKNRDFQNVYKNGKSKANKYLVMYVLENQLDSNRLGISVSKKVGNSVIRHHLTRLIRESYRLNKKMFNSGLDIVVIARESAKDRKYKEIESALLHLGKINGLLYGTFMGGYMKMIKKLSKGINFILIGCIKFYRKFISPMKITPCCRFIPSCSQYAIEALQKYGPLKGSFLAIKRILRCNHFSKGGYDPVP